GVRASDEDNPRGYLEYEPVKNLRANSVWLMESGGKYVKVITQLLPFLRSGLDYRILYIERDLKEVMASQRKMLERSGKPGAAVSDDKLVDVFQKQIEQVKGIVEKSEIPTCYLDYRQTVEEPEKVARKMARFLGEKFDIKNMAAAVDRKLYRQKTEELVS
ncbi:MAG: hypothetical protein AAF492_06190, partial [Verrucomicrobiota bacterium]